MHCIQIITPFPAVSLYHKKIQLSNIFLYNNLQFGYIIDQQRLVDAVHPEEQLSALLRDASNAEYGELIMKDQNAPLWRNGQIPSSNEGSSSPNDAERQAQQQNQKSEQNKRKH